ncbi:MAG TPA: sugar ABC transporter permease [Chloroflexota bacterium]|nr:sugar ABC transporter permease [Chloroflexota bacterium]
MSALAWPRLAPAAAGLSDAARRRYWRQTGIAYLYLAPALVLLTLFHFFPAIFGFYISLFRWGLIQERFVGLENYQRVLVDEAFWSSLGTTVWYVILVIPAEMAIGLVIAYLLFQPIRGRGAYRTAYFLPHITSSTAAAVVWRWMYNQQNGLLNGVFEMIGLPRSLWLNESTGIFKLALGPAGAGLPEWIGGPSLALVSVAAMSVWSYIGFYVVIYLAGLGNISKELYEAARIDGANERQVFFRITLPLLSPTTFFLIVVGVIGAMQAFNQLYVMTRGGSGTRTVTMLVFRTFYEQTRVGYGSAMAFILALFIVALTIVNFRYLGRRVHYD